MMRLSRPSITAASSGTVWDAVRHGHKSAAGANALTQRLSFPAHDGGAIASFLHWFNSVAPNRVVISVRQAR
jgi:hypothetical protein